MNGYDRIRKYVDHRYTTDDTLVLDSALVRISARNLREVVDEIDRLRATISGDRGTCEYCMGSGESGPDRACMSCGGDGADHLVDVTSKEPKDGN